MIGVGGKSGILGILEGISGRGTSGGGNLYSGHSVTGGKGGRLPPKSGNDGARSFLLVLPMASTLQNDTTMKKKQAKRSKRLVKEAILYTSIWV